MYLSLSQITSLKMDFSRTSLIRQTLLSRSGQILRDSLCDRCRGCNRCEGQPKNDYLEIVECFQRRPVLKRQIGYYKEARRES